MVRSRSDFARQAAFCCLGLAIGLSLSGCLEVDPSFVGKISTNGHANEDSTSTNTSTSTESGDKESGQSSDSSNGESDTDESETDATDSDSSMSAGSSSDSSSNNTSSNSDTASTSSESTSDESSGADSSSTTDEPESQIYRIGVDNRGTGELVSNFSSLALTIDHTSMVNLGAHPQGRDLRLVYTDDSLNRTILARTLDFDSSWNRSDTTIWFRGEGLNDNQFDTTHFTLEIGTEADLVNDDPDGVFQAWDDFSSESLTESKWQLGGTGAWAREVAGGSLFLRVAGSGISGDAGASMNTGHRGPGLRFDYKVRQNIVGDSLGCRFGIPAALSTTSGGASIEAVLLGEGSVYSYHDTGTTKVTEQVPAGIADWGFHEYSQLFSGLFIFNGQDGTWIDFHAPAVDSESTFVYPYIGLEMPARCGAINIFELEVQWMRVRQGFYDEPVVSLL